MPVRILKFHFKMKISQFREIYLKDEVLKNKVAFKTFALAENASKIYNLNISLIIRPYTLKCMICTGTNVYAFMCQVIGIACRCHLRISGI
jgi:hypothetical protein